MNESEVLYAIEGERDLFSEFVIDKVASEVLLVLKLLNRNGQL